ncbi:hypothetical protein [Streptomyces sp. NBC_01445]|uniref:hypothetical protein n=1 Tax=Streptomyces sp. NBC_01445 TaxID=2903869 RepID=UPI002DDBF77D|nr:hypothetical protein [Streptomyces sp. NBC_01445]WSE09176.1 hypothetical protein OG574_40920 [Streptomyces sp. NBC_01445]
MAADRRVGLLLSLDAVAVAVRESRMSVCFSGAAVGGVGGAMGRLRRRGGPSRSVDSSGNEDEADRIADLVLE